jgi:hypothetical protein
MQPLTVRILDPLSDPRWPEFVRHHPNASAFHTAGWLRALQVTYGYEPIAFTTSAPSEELRNALSFCVVRSWLTGSRLVSLPFSDHCEPLVENSEELSALHLFVKHFCKQQCWKYLEMRSASPLLETEGGFQMAQTFCLHRLDLRPNPDVLFRSFHVKSVQQMIRRAEREALTYEEGLSESLLIKLYSLLCLTRQRHRLPPQPINWFRNLIEYLGETVCIRIACKDEQPVAGILTMIHGKRIIYKYGGSDARLSKLGGTQLLLWRAIQDAKKAGVEEFDFGRSDCDNTGLIAFKEHWSAERFFLTYWRYPETAKSSLTDGWKARYAKQLFARLPNGVVNLAGNLLYRHIG